MSRDNVEVVRRLYEGWTEGDFRVGLEFFDEDLRFIVDGSVTPTPAEARGVDGMRNEWRDLLSAWEAYRTGPIEHLMESGDKVVAFNRMHGRGRQSAIDMDSAIRAAIFTFRDGRIAELRLTDLDSALKAVGLRE